MQYHYVLEIFDEEFKVYHAFSIEYSDQSEVAIGFMGTKWTTALQSGANESLVQADATFHFVPRQFYQLLNIFLHSGNGQNYYCLHHFFIQIKLWTSITTLNMRNRSYLK